MLIILDSEDGNGKTQISQALASKLDIPYFKYEMEWRADFKCKKEDRFRLCIQHAMPMLMSFIDQTGVSAVFDRGYPSEWVYSNYFNRGTCPESLRHIDDWHFSRGAKIIIPTRQHYSRAEIDEPSITPRVKADLAKLYREFAKWTKCETFFLPVDDEDLEREIRDINKWLF